MQPDLELVHIRKGESFAAWQHGYPFRTSAGTSIRKYEIHLVVATSGKFYIGDHVGEFGPGQLIMTGPNLPQNWISDIRPGQIVPCPHQGHPVPRKLQSRPPAGHSPTRIRPHLLERSRRGLLFDDDTSRAVMPLMGKLIDARGRAPAGAVLPDPGPAGDGVQGADAGPA